MTRTDYWADVRDRSVKQLAIYKERERIQQKEKVKKENGPTLEQIQAEIKTLQPISGRAIAIAIADAYGITLAELKSDRRWRHLAHARQHAMYLMRSHTRLSFNGIARVLGRTDHTTVIHGIHAHSRRYNLPKPRHNGKCQTLPT